MNLFKITMIMMTLMSSLYAEKFQCSFIQEKFRGGTSNEASCSMTPAEVFRQNRTELCNIEKGYGYEDYKNFIVDTKKGIVSWTTYSGVKDYAKPIMKQSWLKKGKTIAEAEFLNNHIIIIKNKFLINSYTITKQLTYYDSVTGELLKVPKKILKHNILFSDKNWSYYLFIPNSNNKAILLNTTAGGEYSWINMRFGKCKKIK